MILPVMKPYTMKWPLKSGFTAYVMFKTLNNNAYSLLIYHNFFNIDIQCPHELLNLSISRKANVMITMI